MAKEIDLTQYNNLRTIGLLKERGTQKIQLNLNQVDKVKEENEILTDQSENPKEEVEIFSNQVEDPKQEIEINYKPAILNLNPKYKDIYDEETGNKIPFNEAKEVFNTENEAGTKIGSPNLENIIEKHIATINEVQEDDIPPKITSITPAKKGTEIELDINFEVTYKKLYKEVSETLTKAVGKSEVASAEEITEKVEDILNRKNNINSEVNLFLYNFFPYIGANLVNTVGNSTINNPNVSSVARLGFGISRALHLIKYFTVVELIAFLGHNFYSLHFLRGISIKKSFGFLSPEELNNQPDILFGKAKGWTTGLLGTLEKKFFQDKIRVIGAGNNILAVAKETYSPKLEFQEDGSSIYLTKQDTDNPDTLDPTNTIWFNRVTEPLVISYLQMEENDAKTGWQPSNEIRKISKFKDSVEKKKNSIPVEGNKILDDAFFVNLNAKKITGINKWKEWKDLSEMLPDDVPDELNASGSNNLFSDAVRGKEFLKLNDRWQIGAIYVNPIFVEDINPFYIPFEFNPTIEEGNLSAVYQATEYLARIGASQSYSRTELPTVTISTKYWAVSHNDKEIIEGGHGWMNFFTLEAIQGIELAFRSLVMPTFPENESDVDNGYKYSKPPLVKVIIGNASDPSPTSPFANLLTYESTNNVVVGDKKLLSSKEKRVHKTFVVTSVSIKKDLIETPIFLDKHRTIRDVFGYDISLTLSEVTASYMDLYPDFRSYYKGYTEAISSEFYN